MISRIANWSSVVVRPSLLAADGRPTDATVVCGIQTEWVSKKLDSRLAVAAAAPKLELAGHSLSDGLSLFFRPPTVRESL